MKFILTILILIPSLVFGQDEKIGRVISVNNKKPIPYVFVKNLSKNIFSSCDNNGIFKMQFSTGDTLSFTHVSSLNKWVIINTVTDTLVVELKDNIQELNEIVVLPTYKKFQKQFLSLKIEEEKPKIYIPGVKIMTEPGVPPPVTIGNPLSFVATKLSKKEKEKKEYRRLLVEDILEKKYYEKLSPEFITSITKLEGEKLHKFMKHCKFKKEFVLNANEYELTVAIKACFEEFKKLTL